MEYEKNFSRNVRRLRKKLGMTQKQLAEATGYSEKSVSKWERGPSIPSVATLFAIARALNTNMETLFLDEYDDVCYLGIDGSGITTTLKLVDKYGSPIRSIRTGCCNPFDIGISAARDVLRQAIYEVCREIPLTSVVMYAGIAGGGIGNNIRQLSTFFREFNFLNYSNGGDFDNIISAGLGERDGISLILGMGIIIFAQQNGQRRRISGWGCYFDDGGSSYNIGRDAIHAYYAAYDGTGKPTMITDEINKLEKLPPEVLLTRLYDGGKAKIASYSDMVFRLADKGDAISEQILTRNMHVVADMLKSVAASYGSDNKVIPVVISGELTSQPTLIERLCRAIGKDSRLSLRILDCEPVDGAIRLAMKLFAENKENP
nr:XRE family transcriptional regulator [Clostridia bacterium]